MDDGLGGQQLEQGTFYWTGRPGRSLVDPCIGHIGPGMPTSFSYDTYQGAASYDILDQNPYRTSKNKECGPIVTHGIHNSGRCRCYCRHLSP
jgi:hypothetical protein